MRVPRITAYCLIRVISEKRFPHSILIISGASTPDDRDFLQKIINQPLWL